METGYELSDPKHPRFHSVHVDLWDNREKDGRPNPLVHWEFTVLEGLSERFATNSLPLAVRILSRMADAGSDLSDFVILQQPTRADVPQSLTYAQASAEVAD